MIGENWEWQMMGNGKQCNNFLERVKSLKFHPEMLTPYGKSKH